MVASREMISRVCRGFVGCSALWDCLCDSVKQPFTYTQGLFSRMRIFRYLVQHFFLITQLKLDRSFLLFPSNAYFNILARLPFAHPSAKIARYVAAVPIHNDISRPQTRFRGKTSIVNSAHCYCATGLTLRRETEHRPLMLQCEQFEPSEPKYLPISKRFCRRDIVSKKFFKRTASHFLRF